MTRTIPILLAALLAFALPLMAEEGATGSVQATGAGVIRDGDIAKARDSAIQDALRKAVEQVVGTYIESSTVVDNYQLLEDKIYSKTKGYVKSFKIVQDGPPQKEINLYEVTIDAEVSNEPIKDDLAAIGLLLARKGNPRTMFFIVEQSIGSDRYAVGWVSLVGGQVDLLAPQASLNTAETTLTEVFAQRGFPVADRQVKQGKVSLTKGFSIDKLTDNQVQELGKLTGAEIVVYGKAVATAQGKLLNSAMNSANAVLTARAVRTDSGMVLGAGTANGAAVHIDEVTAGNEALKQAAAQLADDLINKITEVWSQEVLASQTINLVVGGTGNYDAFAKFKAALAKTPGITAVHQRSLSDSQAELDVEYTGQAQDLADALAGPKFVGGKVKVGKVSPGKIELNLVAAKGGK